MENPFFHEFKRKASFFFKEKIKSARLVLTDVTAAELLTEEAIDGDSWAPDAQTLGLISRAAFEVDEYWRIVEVLHKRLTKFDRKTWRASYKALMVLEHLLTHGPIRVAEEFQIDKDIIVDMRSFQYVDDKGLNWGFRVGNKSERVTKLLEDNLVLKEERTRAQKVTSGIEGFDSLYHRSRTFDNGVKQVSSSEAFVRCNSQHNNIANLNGEVLASSEQLLRSQDECEDTKNPVKNRKSRASTYGDESSMEESHPFCDSDNQSRASLLSSLKC